MADRADITPELLRQLFSYDPDTGRFLWLNPPHISGFSEHGMKIFRGQKAGKEAFTYLDAKGYYMARVNGVRIAAHRAAWAIVNGYLPAVVDHLNGNPLDNRLCNLRATTQANNARNNRLRADNTLGCPGLFQEAKSGMWVARIGGGKNRRIIGRFTNKDDAIHARKAAEAALGYGPNHGR